MTQNARGVTRSAHRNTCAAVEFEEVAGAESEHHQVEGVIAKQAVHLEQMAVCRVSIHHKDDGEQIKHTHCMVFRFILHR